MTLAAIKSYLAHYALGLVASGANAGFTAMKVTSGWSLGAIVKPSLITLPTAETLIMVFVSAAGANALTYFNAHPFPVIAPDPEKPVSP